MATAIHPNHQTLITRVSEFLAEVEDLSVFNLDRDVYFCDL